MSHNQCKYSLFENYFNDEEKHRLEALKHAEECPPCRDKMIVLEEVFSPRRNIIDSPYTVFQDENLLAEIADKLIASENQTLLEQLLAKKDSEDNISNHLASLVSTVSHHDESDYLQVPEYLGKIIENRTQEMKEDTNHPVVLKIKDGLTLLSKSLSGIFDLSTSADTVNVRSTAPALKNENGKGVVQFFQLGPNKQENIVYHVAQDSSETVLITIKFEMFNTSPIAVNLKEKGRIVSSYKVAENYAYFAKVKPGQYDIEMKFTENKAPIHLPFHLVTD